MASRGVRLTTAVKWICLGLACPTRVFLSSSKVEAKVPLEFSLSWTKHSLCQCISVRSTGRHSLLGSKTSVLDEELAVEVLSSTLLLTSVTLPHIFAEMTQTSLRLSAAAQVNRWISRRIVVPWLHSGHRRDQRYVLLSSLPYPLVAAFYFKITLHMLSYFEA